MNIKAAAAAPNRGILLDAVVFVVNLLLIRRLARAFVEMVQSASGGDPVAKLSVTAFLLAIFILPAAGSVLKRWHFHRRRGGREAGLGDGALGCLLHPAIYLSVSLVVGTAAAAMIGVQVFGENFNDRAEVFLPTMLAVVVLSIAQTVLVYRYFSRPKQPPRLAFLRGERSELLGDVCIFVNVILFQVLWNVMLGGRFQRVGGVEDLLGRLFLVGFLSVLVYLPPRIFYLADDARRRASWLTIVLAISPIVLHVVLGVI